MEEDMQSREKLIFQGIPDKTFPGDAGVLRASVSLAVSRFLEATGLADMRMAVGTATLMRKAAEEAEARRVAEEVAARKDAGDDASSLEERTQQYVVRKPLYTFDQLIVSDELLDTLLSTIEMTQVESLVFEQWGLRKIEPFSRSVLNFYGPPGTGKTLAAHAIAQRLGRDILVASYAEVESKYVGDGPKNIQALFLAAEHNNAVLFIDEADSLLSRRLTHVTQGAEQAINSMRSQLFLSLDRFRGVAIFATNLVENYDRAFETRVRHVFFPMPDREMRSKIWRTLLVPELPQYQIALDELALHTEGLSGRDIKNAIVDAAVRVARRRGEYVEMKDLLAAIERMRSGHVDLLQAE
jgi:ATP-dependent 26S proteasome regulatory subunit